MRIIPAVLTSNIDELIREVDYIGEFTDEADIDIMDGSFVPDKSISLKDLPKKDGLTYNLDLMVSKPINYIEQALELKKDGKLNLGRVFVHVESEYSLEELIKASKDNFILGFSLSVPTSIENFLSVYKKIQDALGQVQPPIQLKTVEIGKQGNPYHPEVLGKIKQLRDSGFQGQIYLDGGIDPDVIMSIRELGIEGVSVGSFISHSSDPLIAFNRLKDAIWKKDLD